MQDDNRRGTPDRFGKDFWQLTCNFLQAEKLQTLIKAAGVEVEPIWTSIFAKVRTNPDDASDIETFFCRLRLYPTGPSLYTHE